MCVFENHLRKYRLQFIRIFKMCVSLYHLCFLFMSYNLRISVPIYFRVSLNLLSVKAKFSSRC